MFANEHHNITFSLQSSTRPSSSELVMMDTLLVVYRPFCAHIGKIYEI